MKKLDPKQRDPRYLYTETTRPKCWACGIPIQGDAYLISGSPIAPEGSYLCKPCHDEACAP